MVRKLKQRIIPGLEEWVKNVEQLPGMKKVIIGRFHPTPGVAFLSVTFSRQTETGIKCRAKGTGGTQDVYIVYRDPQKTPSSLSMYVIMG